MPFAFAGGTFATGHESTNPVVFEKGFLAAPNLTSRTNKVSFIQTKRYTPMKTEKPNKAKAAKASISPAPLKRNAPAAKAAPTPPKAKSTRLAPAAPISAKTSAPAAAPTVPNGKRSPKATVVPPAPTPVPAPAPAPAAKAAPGKTPTPAREITADLIAVRAYILWEKQGRPQGTELANWLQAESQLKQEIRTFSA